MSIPIQPVEKPARLSESEVAADYIRAKIFSGEYHENMKLSERKLQQELGCGLNAIRQALTQLQVENLLTVEPQAGHFVRGVSGEESREILGARFALDTFLAWHLAQKKELSLQEAIECNQRLWRIAESGVCDEVTKQRFIADDIEFHCALARAAKFPLIADWIRGLENRIRLVAMPELTVDQFRDVAREHQQILEAIRPAEGTTDQEKVRSAIRHHLANTSLRWAGGNRLVRERSLPDIFPDSAE